MTGVLVYATFNFTAIVRNEACACDQTCEDEHFGYCRCLHHQRLMLVFRRSASPWNIAYCVQPQQPVMMEGEIASKPMNTGSYYHISDLAKKLNCLISTCFPIRRFQEDIPRHAIFPLTSFFFSSYGTVFVSHWIQNNCCRCFIAVSNRPLRMLRVLSTAK
jgi:hypothetical protein